MLNIQLIDTDKPVFKNTVDNCAVTCMLDTGASMSVWCGSEKLLRTVYKDVQNTNKTFLLGGFGGTDKNCIKCKVFKIPSFKISDGKNQIILHNMFFVTQFDRGFGCDFILSGNLFGKCDYTIVNSLSINNRQLHIKSEKDSYVIGLQYVNTEKSNKYFPNGLVNNTYSFSQIKDDWESYEYICIDVIVEDKKDYCIIKGKQGKEIKKEKSEVKQYLKKGHKIKNLKLTSDNRLYFKNRQ